MATEASISCPDSVTLDAARNLYIADRCNQRIRKVDLTGTITTIAGNGIAGYSGDGGPAIEARLDSPRGVTADPYGNVFVADGSNQRIRRIVADFSVLYMSFTTATIVPGGVGLVQDEDIVAYDTERGTWSLYFDGSAVGFSTFAVDALAVLANGDILISLDKDGSLPGLFGGPSGSSIDDSDILRFSPTSLGANTAGTCIFYFDGSDVGLTQSAEDVDALEILADGSLLISTTGNPSVTGLTSLASQDLIRFVPTTLGAATVGTWSYYFDGSDVSLSTSSENVDAVSAMSSGGFLLSTTDAFSVPGVAGADEDILKFMPTRLGSTTSGGYQMHLDLSALGISTSADVSALDSGQ